MSKYIFFFFHKGDPLKHSPEAGLNGWDPYT